MNSKLVPNLDKKLTKLQENIIQNYPNHIEKDIKNFIDMAERGDEALSERLKIFHRRREILRGELESLKEVLGVIEYKCWYYETASKAGTEEVMRNLKPSDIPEKFRKARESLHVV